MRCIFAAAISVATFAPASAQDSKPTNPKLLERIRATKITPTQGPRIVWGEGDVPALRRTPRGLLLQRLALSPDGKHLALQNQGQTFVLDIARRHWTEPSDLTSECALATIFDGGAGLFLDAGHVVRADAEGAERIGDLTVPERVDAFANRDGSRVLASGLTSRMRLRIELLDLDADEKRRVKQPTRSASVSAVGWSHDRHHVAIAWCEIGARGRLPQSLQILDRSGKVVREFAAGDGVVRDVWFSVDDRRVFWADGKLHVAETRGEAAPESVDANLLFFSQLDPLVGIGVSPDSVSRWDCQRMRRVDQPVRQDADTPILNATINAQHNRLAVVTDRSLLLFDIE